MSLANIQKHITKLRDRVAADTLRLKELETQAKAYEQPPPPKHGGHQEKKTLDNPVHRS